MKIRFDNTALLAGIGLVPWTRLGPERWFKNYKIASLYGWDLQNVEGAPTVVSLAGNNDEMPHLPKLNSQRLLENAEFQQLIKTEFAGYDFLTYKPVVPPKELAGHKFLSVNGVLTSTLENKVEFRANFADLNIPFPAYRIVNRADLRADDATLQDLLAGRSRVILQDEMLSGGRGTFKVSDVSGLAYALDSIEALEGGQRIVVSDMVENARERSVQCVATQYGTFVGHLQKQIIANPLLANLDVHDGDRFCGGEISPNDPLRSLYPEIREHALAIGARLAKLGYRGIFSVDCLVDQNGKVFVLEVNPRLTGMTPLVTALYREGKDIPFYLLHMLEAAGIDYEITDETVAEMPPEGSLMVLHSQQNTTTQIAASPQSGLYNLADLSFVGKQYRLPGGVDEKHLLVQQYTPPGFKIKPGGRLVTILTNSQVTDDNDRLLPEITQAVQHLLNQVTLKEATQ